MRADYIASLGRIGKVSASSLASLGRVGQNVLLVVIPVEYTPFTLATVIPAVHEADILASEFFVKIVEVGGKPEIVAGYVYAIAFDRPVDVETLIAEYDAVVVPVVEYEVDVPSQEVKVEVIDGGFYD